MFAIVSAKFFDQKGEYIESRSEEIQNSTQDDFYKYRIKDYLDCIRHNETQNDKKAEMVIISQKLFILAVCFLLGVMMALLLLLVTGYASVNLLTMPR